MGLQGNLTAGEIVEQLAYALRFSGIRNIVFMGMGEPLNNYKAVKVPLHLRACVPQSLCFVITTRVLRSVLGKTIVMVLLGHSSECGCFVCFA